MTTFRGELEAQVVESIPFDTILAACGYESRAKYLPERLTRDIPQRIACRFPDQHSHAFKQNEVFFAKLGYRFLDASDAGFGDALLKMLGPIVASGSSPKVFVDISSQSRSRLACILQILETLSRDRSIDVVFGYSLAKYDEPSTAEAPNVEIGPVSARFAGWTRDPEREIGLIIGLGYEQDRALGAVEYLEATETWALIPRSPVREYSRALLRANRLLLTSIEPSRVLHYDVLDPNATYARLTSLILHVSQTGSVILLPGGPKILTLLGLLVGMQHVDVAIWRVSAGSAEQPVDRRPSGTNVFVRQTFGESERQAATSTGSV